MLTSKERREKRMQKSVLDIRESDQHTFYSLLFTLPYLLGLSKEIL